MINRLIAIAYQIKCAISFKLRNNKMTLGQIAAVQELMRMAVTGQKNVDGLIGYYRGIIDNYNDERAQWALHYEQLKDSANNKHTLQNQLDNSRHSINQLQSQLNTIKAALARERQIYFQALEESQSLKQKCEQHRQKYRDMVAVCKPISVGKKKGQPRQNSRYAPHNQSNISNATHQEPHSNPQLQLQLINLSKDHDQKRSHLAQQIDLLKQELEQLLSQHGQRSQTCSQQYKQALEMLANVEGKTMHLTSEYFKLRMENYQSERRLQQQNQILRLKAVALAKKLQLLRSDHQGEFKTVQKQVKTHNKNFKQKYDSQLKQKEEHLTILKEQHARINDIYLLKLSKLEEDLRATNEKQKNLEEKYRSESNSLRGQIKILRNRLQKPGVREMRAQLAEEEGSEESSATLSMGELEKINKEVEALQKKI